MDVSPRDGDPMSRLQRIAVGAVLGIALSVATALALFRNDEPDLVLAPREAQGSVNVSIEGAVARPGLVQVPTGSRLTDVIAAAGGLLPEADVSGLYIAARVADGQRIIVVRGESLLPSPDPISPARSSPSADVDEAPADPTSGPNGQLINLNTADAALLETLPGIGPVLAQRIIEYRETNGPFLNVDELESIDGISTRLVEELRPLVTVDG